MGARAVAGIGVLTVAWLFAAVEAFGSEDRAIVGLDHVPVAVRDLEAATRSYASFGFAIKPGRTHANAIRNNHIKFVDGSGLELITASAGLDSQSARYLSLIERSFEVRDGRVLVFPAKSRLLEGRPVFGVVMTLGCPAKRVTYTPGEAHGFWLVLEPS